MIDAIESFFWTACSMGGTGPNLGSGRVLESTVRAVASPSEDAEALPLLHARHVLHDAAEAQLVGLHDAGDHEDLRASPHRATGARRHLLADGGKGRGVLLLLRGLSNLGPPRAQQAHCIKKTMYLCTTAPVP